MTDVALTFFAYELGRLCQQKLRLPIFNPILIAAVLTAVVLAAAGIPNETYQSHCEAFSWLLTPATPSSAGCAMTCPPSWRGLWRAP